VVRVVRTVRVVQVGWAAGSYMQSVTNPISRFGFGALLGLSLHLVTHPNEHFRFDAV
jgi:hypothetical protein